MSARRGGALDCATARQQPGGHLDVPRDEGMSRSSRVVNA